MADETKDEQKVEQEKNKGGRPTKFSQAIADAICVEIMKGKPLRKIAKSLKLTTQTIFYWIQTRPGFSDQYARAKEIQAEQMADEIVSISDEKPKVTTTFTIGEIEKRETKLDNAGVHRNRLRVDARKWVAAKLLPKKFGEKLSLEASGPDGGPIPVKRDLTGLSNEELEYLGGVVAKFAGNQSGTAKTA